MSLKTLVFLLLATCLSRHVSAKTVAQLKREVLDQILPKNENDVFVAPGNNTTDGVTVVETSVYVLDIESVNERDMEFTLTMYFRQAWKDQRLKYAPSSHFNSVSINEDNVIWTPDTFFVNQKTGHGFDIVRPNVFIKILPDGSVLCSKKISVTLACPMDFSRFPFDRQQCAVRMESYGSGTDTIRLKWKEYSAISVSESVRLPLFQLEKIITSFGTVRLTTADYSTLSINFYFTRQLSYYVHQIYLPSIVLVALSWLPFWLKRQALVARLLISVGLLITYTMSVSKFHAKQPKTSYATSLLYFTWICMAFMVVSVLETIVLHVLSIEDEPTKECVESGNVNNGKRKARFVALASRFLVPLLFGLHCFVYFGTAGGFGSDELLEVPGNKTAEIVINAL